MVELTSNRDEDCPPSPPPSSPTPRQRRLSDRSGMALSTPFLVLSITIPLFCEYIFMFVPPLHQGQPHRL